MILLNADWSEWSSSFHWTSLLLILRMLRCSRKGNLAARRILQRNSQTATENKNWHSVLGVRKNASLKGTVVWLPISAIISWFRNHVDLLRTSERTSSWPWRWSSDIPQNSQSIPRVKESNSWRRWHLRLRTFDSSRPCWCSSTDGKQRWSLLDRQKEKDKRFTWRTKIRRQRKR